VQRLPVDALVLGEGVLARGLSEERLEGRGVGFAGEVGHGDHALQQVELGIGFLVDPERSRTQIDQAITGRHRSDGVVLGEEQPVRAEAGRETLLAVGRPDQQCSPVDLVLAIRVGGRV
jgi:hypothetical protein